MLAVRRRRRPARSRSRRSPAAARFAREQRGRADACDELAEVHLHDAGRRARDELAHEQDQRAADQQLLAAEEVAEHAEGELEGRDRQQDGVRDPVQL
jgi:hypothetical protein